MINVLMMLAAMVAQAEVETETVKCPVITVVATGDEPGKKHFFVSADAAPETVTFRWSISSGSIIEGYGTPAITVEDSAGNNVTATVELGGLPNTCSRTASETATIK